jgi:hypothetical protein
VKTKKDVRQLVVEFAPDELLQFFSIKNGIWKVKCKGLPDDCRVIAVYWDAMREVLRFLLETQEPEWFYQVPNRGEPPCFDDFAEVEFIGYFDNHSRA